MQVRFSTPCVSLSRHAPYRCTLFSTRGAMSAPCRSPPTPALSRSARARAAQAPSAPSAPSRRPASLLALTATRSVAPRRALVGSRLRTRLARARHVRLGCRAADLDAVPAVGIGGQVSHERALTELRTRFGVHSDDRTCSAHERQRQRAMNFCTGLRRKACLSASFVQQRMHRGPGTASRKTSTWHNAPPGRLERKPSV